jgi:FkbM family methyltransferase
MGARVEKLNELNRIADELQFSFPDRIRLLLSTYLQRLRDRVPGVPKPVFRVRFDFEKRPVSFFVRSNDVDFQHLDGLFIRREYKVPIENPRRILDLGGNIGSADLFFHCMYPGAEIVSVEPLPDNLPILRRNWEANGIQGHIIPGAVADQSCQARFYVGPVDCSSLVPRAGYEDNYIDVQCYTIPELMERAGWNEIDVLKIDIEGGEIAVFKNSTQWAHKVKVIIGELHNGYTVEDLDRDLSYQFDCTQVFEYPPPGSMKGVLAVRRNIIPDQKP